MKLGVNVVVIEKRDVRGQSKKGLYSTRTTKLRLRRCGLRRKTMEHRYLNTDGMISRSYCDAHQMSLFMVATRRGHAGLRPGSAKAIFTSVRSSSLVNTHFHVRSLFPYGSSGLNENDHQGVLLSPASTSSNKLLGCEQSFHLSFDVQERSTVNLHEQQARRLWLSKLGSAFYLCGAVSRQTVFDIEIHFWWC